MVQPAWWDEEWDVVVAGGGAAGLMAALEASERGMRVLLVEKQPGLGGATAMAVGTLSASGTALQFAAGIRDDVDAHFADYLKFIPAGKSKEDYDLELTRLLIERAPSTLARLLELGVRFTGPHPEPPHSVYRMHNAVPDGGAYVDALSRAALARGVAIRTETAIHELHRDDNGVVSALVLRHTRRRQFSAVRVRRGVVLATGYFSANDELARAHGRPPEAGALDSVLETATGDGIALARALGAATAGMNAPAEPFFLTALPPYVHPDPRLLQEGAILVNNLGRRFANEFRAPEWAANGEPRKTAFIIFDDRLAGRIATAGDDSARARDGWLTKKKLFLSTFPEIAYAYLEDYRRRTGYFFEAERPEELAGRIGVPAADLVEELRRFNRAASSQGDDAFGRDPVGPGVSVPPFYAVGPIKPVIGSSGGLKVNRGMHVLDVRGRVIPRLYAAGMNGASNTLLAGHGHALSWAMTSGRIAGVNASAETPTA